MCYLTTVALTSFLNARILHPISYNSFITKAEIQLKVRMCEFSSHITILLRPIILELFFSDYFGHCTFKHSNSYCSAFRNNLEVTVSVYSRNRCLKRYLITTVWGFKKIHFSFLNFEYSNSNIALTSSSSDYLN